MSEANGREGSGSRAPSPGVARRGLLRGLAGGGLAAVAAGSAAAEDDAAAADRVPDPDPTRIDFHATDHTRWFYRRARW